MIELTIRKNLDTPYVQTAVPPVIDEAGDSRAPVFVGENISHEVEAYLGVVKYVVV